MASSPYMPAKRLTDADKSRSGGKPLKVLYFLSEGKQSRQLKTRCIASAVVVNGKHLLLTSSSAIKEEDKKESLILNRFSRRHFGRYTVKASFFKEFGEFTLLKIEGKPNENGGKRTMYPLNLELPPSESLEAFTSVCAVENFEFKFKWDIGSGMIELMDKTSTRIETTSIAGAPIIIEQSGRVFIIGVLGLTSDKQLCPSYLNKNILEIMKQPQPFEKNTKECLKDEQESNEATRMRLERVEDQKSATKRLGEMADSRMASGPAASTHENTNYARLSRLLVDVGSTVLRDIFDRIHPPANLHTVLSSSSVLYTLQSLKKKRVLNPLQWGNLFPAYASSVSSANFDITLLMVLLRNICDLSPPVSTGNWEDLPSDSDSSTGANIVRIKWCRNNVYAHATKASVDDATFNALWHKISKAILALKPGYGIFIRRLKTECMDPTAEAHFEKLLSDWKKDDDNLKKMLERTHDTLGEIRENQERTHIELGDLKENQERTNTELGDLKEMMEQLQAREWSTKESLKVERDLSEEKKTVGDEGACALAKMLEGNKTLTELNLNIKRTGDKGVVALAEALEDSKVRELSFKFDEIGDEGTATLAKMLEKNSNLTELHLSASKIGDQAAAALAEALTRNSALTKLNLCFDNIGDSGAAALAEALKKNTALTELKLIMNGVRDEGAEALGKALTENSMIKKFNVSFNDTGN